MKKTVRLLSLLLIVVMVLGLTACGASTTSSGSSAASDEKVEISFMVCEYSDNTQSYMQKIIDAYQKDHPNVTIKLEMVSWDDATTTVQSRVGSGQAPDILNLDTFSQYTEDNLLLPASDYVSDDLKSAFYTQFYDNNKAADGNIYCVPFVASVRNLYYSNKIFKECGIANAPATWDDVLKDCQIILDKYNGSVYPFGMDFTTNEGQAYFSYFMWNFGGDWTDGNGKWTLNSAQNVQALQFMVDMYNKGYTNANPLTEIRDDMQAMMNNGKLAMMCSANFFPALYPDLDLGVASIPSDGKQDSIQLGVEDRLMVFDNKYSDAKLSAISDFINYFFTCDTYADWCLKEGLLPTTTKCFDYLISTDSKYQIYKDALQSVKFYPTSMNGWSDVRIATIDGIQACASGTKTAQQALDDAQAKAESLK